MYTSLLDAHFYIFSRWVLDLLPELPAPKSIKTGLIPKLLQLQHTPSAVPTSALHGPLELVGDMSSAAVRSEQFLCQAYVLPADKLYCRRSNTSAAFLDINMEVRLAALASLIHSLEVALLDPKLTKRLALGRLRDPCRATSLASHSSRRPSSIHRRT